MSFKKVDVSPGYRCPFCPDHSDDTFFESKVFGRPICQGCDFEITAFLASERPADPVVESVERFTGRPWAEVRILLLQEELDNWCQLDRERPTSYVESFARFGWTAAQVWERVRRNIDSTRASLESTQTPGAKG